MGTSLPPKEANLFKLIAKSYETKQYKKGLKAADQILKKFPEHGETLAMKGLTLNCMDSKTEAYELVRKGLKNDLKSHVCWHVYGLLYRSDREYREAIKCYRNALRIDPENIQILRDLSLLQAQMRDLGGYVETCRTLLTLKPNHRNYWIGFAIAHHLNKDPSKAVDILVAYEGTLEEDYPPDNERYEHSEMLLYKVSLLEEAGDLDKALEELNNKSSKIVDSLGVKEIQASLFLKLNRMKEAEEAYFMLLDINSENYRYHEGVQKSLGISIDSVYQGGDVQAEELTELYSNLQIKYPKSVAIKRIPFDFLEIGSFRLAVDKYMRPLLRKGVPSLFSDLKSLYAQPGKADVLEEILLSFENSLKSTGTFPESLEQEAPSTLLWTLFLLAQHFDRRGQYEKALQKIDEAILHTPTVIDLYLVKGRIFKHAGDLVAAAALADEARSMDLADRFLNSECVKRMLQADQVEQAEKTALLFTKDGDQHNNLYDMQCMWYELASGDSFSRQGSLGKALKKYLAVEKHYADMVEDQFDFHTYCIRKMTLRAYVRMLRFQDHLHSNRYFHRAASSAIRCYLRLFDSPPRSAAEEEEAAVVGLAPAERKRLRQKQRKEAARAKKEAEEKAKEEEAASLSSKGGKRGSQQPKPTDTDPDGDKLLQAEDPLGEATKYLKLLQDHSAQLLETHLLAFEIYMRKNKFLLALQALKRQLKLGADSPDVHRSMIRFFNVVDKLPAAETDSDKLIQSVINLERACFECLESKTLLEANQDFLSRHKDSLRHRAAAAEMLHLLSPEQKAAAVEILETSVCRPWTSGALVAEGVGERGLKDCSFVYEMLATSLNDLDAASRWKSRCTELFPFSTFFQGPKSSSSQGSANHAYCQKLKVGYAPAILTSNGDVPGFSELKLQG
ncbi:hypothetical protein GOP47_0020570 [Adiantum capillus-veneris]|uniref:Uncharacterized protein n=1 Tax=Adiantum capillus-veneris TaxID=13818 RepID=A0A9D4U9Y7_ADICA|nr:hypothetical protein GOP47_0020570 [Adiantum capillus-veneris]